MTGSEIMGILILIGIGASTLDVILRAIFPKHYAATMTDKERQAEANKQMMNQRVSETGVRLGATLDAINSRARDRKPTNWR